MISRKLSRIKKEKKVGLSLRLDEAEFSFLHEVKDKLGCNMSDYIRFLIHRSTYEESKPRTEQEQRVMQKVTLLMKEKKLTKTYRLLLTKSEHEELQRIKLERGIPKNKFIRWLLRRRMLEWKKLGGELFEIV